MFFDPGSATRTPGTGSLTNYFDDISRGDMNLTGSVKGWYTEPRTTAVGMSSGGSTNQDCIDAAKVNGYTPPAGSTVVVVLPFLNGVSLGGRYETSATTSPNGYRSWALVPANIDFATMAPELGHSIDLPHSYSRESSLGDVEYGAVGIS